MTDVSAPELVSRRRESAGEPAGALVLLHGRGADEHDLFPLLDIFDPTSQTVDALMKLELPAGVDVEIKALGK